MAREIGTRFNVITVILAYVFRIVENERWNYASDTVVRLPKTGFPNKYPSFPGFNNLRRNGNNCRWCPADRSVRCGLHRQSPIDLQRDRAVPGHPNWKECPDWHWMPYLDDTCTWDDMKSQFTIERHALQIHTPQLPNGDINCVDGNNRRRYPRLDYSKGFPDWWWLQRTDVHVPSNHIQEGTRYAAEVVLAHFYEINHVKNQVKIICCLMSFPR